MPTPIEITFFYTGERANTCTYRDLATAQANAAFHVGPRPQISASALSDVYACNPGTAYSLRAKGATVDQLFPLLSNRR